jgi:hypothetical protein
MALIAGNSSFGLKNTAAFTSRNKRYASVEERLDWDPARLRNPFRGADFVPVGGKDSDFPKPLRSDIDHLLFEK